MVHPHVVSCFGKLGRVGPLHHAEQPQNKSFSGSFVRANLNSAHLPSHTAVAGGRLSPRFYKIHRFFKSLGVDVGHQHGLSSDIKGNFLEEINNDKYINSDIKENLALGAKGVAELIRDSHGSALSKNVRKALQSVANLENKLQVDYVASKEKIRLKDEAANQHLEKKIDKSQDKLEHKNARDKESIRRLKGEKVRLQRRIGVESATHIQLTPHAQKSIRRRIEKIEKKLGKLDQAIKKRDAMIVRARVELAKKKETDAQRAIYLCVEEVSLQAYKDLSHLSRIIDRLIKEKMASDPLGKMVDDSLPELEKVSHDLRDVADLYGGVAALAGQGQQVLFDQLHKLSIFKNRPAVGTATTTEQGVTLSVGGGWGDGINKVTLGGALEAKKSKTIAADKPDDFNSLVQKKLTTSLNLEASTAAGILSLNAGAAASMEVMTDYFESGLHDDDSLVSISKHDLVRDNDSRLSSFILSARFTNRVLMNSKFRAMRGKATDFRNLFLRPRGEEKNPYLPRYINTQLIEKAARANTTLVERFQKVNGNTGQPSQDNTVNASQSLQDTRSLADKMIPLSPVVIKPGFAQAGTVTGALSASGKLGLWSSEIETAIGDIEFKAGIKLSAEARVKHAWFNGRRNKFSREVVDLDTTGSLAVSNQLIKDCVAYFHEKLSAGEKFPEHMQGIIDLYQQSIKVEHAEELGQHLLSATAQLKALEAHFAQWRKDALQLQRLAGKYKKNAVLPLHYRQVLERIRAAQFSVDRLSDEKLSTKDSEKIAIAAVVKMYDELSVTAAILERAACLDKVLELLKKEQDVDLKAAAQDFVELYQKMTACLDNPQLGLSKKHLLANNLLQAQCALRKHGVSRQGNIEAALTLPDINDHLEEPKLGAGITATVAGLHVENHPNIARNGEYRTVSCAGQLSLFGLQEKAGEWVLRKVLPEVDVAAIAEVLGDVVGLTDGDVGLTVTASYKDNYLESVQISYTKKKSLNFSIIPMTKLAASPAKLGVKVSDKFIRNEVLYTLLGDDLAIHMLQEKRLDAVLKADSAKVASPDGNTTSENRLQVEKVDIPTRHAFFGLNSVASILDKFSQGYFEKKSANGVDIPVQKMAAQQATEETLNQHISNHSSFAGLGIFNQSCIDAYLNKTKAEASSPKNVAKILAVLSQLTKKDAIQPSDYSDATENFKELGKYLVPDIFSDGNPDGSGLQAMQGYVKKLLDSRVEAGVGGHDISARDYLASASEKERLNFYASNKVGQDLFSAYRLIIKQANEMKVRLNGWQPLIVKQ